MPAAAVDKRQRIMQIREVMTVLFLAVMGWKDWKKKEISLLLTGTYGIIGLAFSIYAERPLEDWLLPFLSKVSRLSHFANLDLPGILVGQLPWPLPQRLDELAHRAGHRIEWHWVKGHAGDPGNERADALANKGVEQALGR